MQESNRKEAKPEAATRKGAKHEAPIHQTLMGKDSTSKSKIWQTCSQQVEKEPNMKLQYINH